MPLPLPLPLPSYFGSTIVDVGDRIPRSAHFERIDHRHRSTTDDDE
jgi:hypothetical protein